MKSHYTDENIKKEKWAILITSDGDYLDLTTLLKQQGLKVLLIYNKDENTSNSLSYNLKCRSKNIHRLPMLNGDSTR